ncbi:unnamed protein product [Symbiodinium natans]|uniref:Tyrosine specific protein phosphatases domain-containing protein n=1 Tax=Symbiodinium natans TaxID=878477 RepID=A0A812V1X3_9DINO|nr:unnamed protein product [Symbiodinium natans]
MGEAVLESPGTAEPPAEEEEAAQSPLQRSKLIRKRLNDAWCKEWTVLDKQMYSASKKCKLNNIETWPVDAVSIFRDEKHHLLLGSVKAACEIEEVNRSLGVRVTVVVTMSDDEWKRWGERSDYEEYYKSLGVVNLRYGGWDKILRPGEEYDAKKAEYKERWQKVCRDLDAVEAPGQKTILFHCFAGLNRSTSALCAFMILRKGLSAEEAVERMIRVRAGQWYWRDRQYFIEGLVETSEAQGL